mmetsp:Transcript_4353/g.5486  ORF Transcript_4353/g.5486 Transcript_4353/m.5486 type:complete len:81 (+) Transcript_4353:101-343(+)
MSEIYGGEHLLRLFIKLPTLFEHVELDKSELCFFQSQIQLLLKFIAKNKEKYFNGSFKRASEEYVQKYDSICSNTRKENA